MSSTPVDPSLASGTTEEQSDEPPKTRDAAADLFHRLLHDGSICHFCFRRKRIVDEDEDEAEARHLFETNPNAFHKLGHEATEDGEIIPENTNITRDPQTSKEVVPGRAKEIGEVDGYLSNPARRERARSRVVCSCGRIDYDGDTRSRSSMIDAITQIHYRLHEIDIKTNLHAMKSLVKQAKSNPSTSGNDLDIFEKAIFFGRKRADDRDKAKMSVRNHPRFQNEDLADVRD